MFLPQLVGSGGGKKMDKFMNSPWVMKIVALLLALLLYMSVNLEEPNKPSASQTESNINYQTETITNVPVRAYYNDKNKIVTGVPEYATLTIQGPVGDVTSTKFKKDYEVYVDLNKYVGGTHKVEMQYKNIPNTVSVQIKPKYANVTIEEKVTKKFSVEASFDTSKFKERYVPSQAIVEPRKVQISGAQSQINRVAYVKAVVELDDSDDTSETIEKKAQVIALDRNLNKVNVQINPSTVDVTIPVSTHSKEVPVKIQTTGNLPDGVVLDDLKVTPGTVKLYGSEEALSKIDFIDDIEVDISELQKSKTFVVDVPLPEGVTSVAPSKVTIKAEVKQKEETTDEQTDTKETDNQKNDDEPSSESPKDDEQGDQTEQPTTSPDKPTNGSEEPKDQTITKTLKGVSVSLTNTSSDYNYDLLTPSGGKVDVEVTGSEKVINALQAGDIQLSVDMSGVQSGETTVPISVKVPDGVKATATPQQAKVKVTEPDTPTTTPPSGGDKGDKPSDSNSVKADDSTSDQQEKQ